MDNKFINRDLIERYVRQQLNDEELALFRGRLMFDADLRKEVVETKMLLNGLAAIAKEGGYITPSKAPAPTPSSNAVRSSATRYRAAAVIAALLLIGSLSYYWGTSTPMDNASKPSTDTPIINSQPQVDKINTVEVEPNENNIATNPAENSNTKNNTKNSVVPSPSPNQPKPIIPTKNNQSGDNDKGEDRKVYASIKKVKTDFNDFSEDQAFATPYKPLKNPEYDSFSKNQFLEDQVTNATTKSKSLISDVKLKNFSKLVRDQHGSVSITCKGNILNSKGKSFVFKIFNNKVDDYINNSQKYQHHFTTISGNASNTFEVFTRIDLPAGLYYYIIEEDINGEEDMIFAGKFRVTNN